MNSANSEVVVQRIVLQQPIAYDLKEYPVSITYRSKVHSATIKVAYEQNIPYWSFGATSSNSQRSDMFLSLQVTEPSVSFVSFKLEVEDTDKNVVFLFLGLWQTKLMPKILNLSELRRQNPNLFINGGTDVTVVITLGPRDRLFKPKGNEPQDRLNKPKENAGVTLAESLHNMVVEGILTDVILVTEEAQFNCHKVVLAATSEMFRAMFQTDTKENKQTVVDLRGLCDGSTINGILEYLYTKEAPTNIEQYARTLLVAADYFHLDALKNSCIDILCQLITVDTVAEILELTEQCNADFLKTKAVSFIVDNYQQVLDTPGWKRLPNQMAKSLISTIVSVAVSKQNTKNFNRPMSPF